MKLQDFLKVEKVRCVKAYGDCLTVGKEYSVLDIRMEVKVKDDEGDNCYWESDNFEPVLDSAENPRQKMELTPEFETEASGPKFKVGDRVYYGNENRILTIAELDDDGWISPDRWVGFINNKKCCHATPENYALLSQLYPHIKFEAPPKPLTGSDLARAMLDKGWKYVPCYISDSSDTHALERQTRNTAVIIGTHKDHPSFFIYGSGKSFISYAAPFDPRTGEPLTEAVLDE